MTTAPVLPYLLLSLACAVSVAGIVRHEVAVARARARDADDEEGAPPRDGV